MYKNIALPNLIVIPVLGLIMWALVINCQQVGKIQGATMDYSISGLPIRYG